MKHVMYNVINTSQKNLMITKFPKWKDVATKKLKTIPKKKRSPSKKNNAPPKNNAPSKK